MHVLLIIEGTYPWYRGGVSEWVYQYLKNLPHFTFSILQIATDEFQGLDPSNALYPFTENIEHFVRISPPDFSGDPEHYLSNWLRQISPQLESIADKYELVHVTNTGFAGWLGGKLSEIKDVPMLLTEHAIYWKEVEMGAVALECGYKIPKDKNEKFAVTDSFKKFAAFTYSAARQVVTVSESNIPFQKKLGAEDIRYIPNGIPESWLISKKERGKQPVIGWVGRCAEMKNPLAFFDFVESFRKQEISPKFVMLLSDANEQSLEKEVRGKAENFPEVKCIWNQSAKDYFSQFDFLMITSHNESQPLVMLEALAHKALPVGHQIGDLTKKYGLIFDSDYSVGRITEEVEGLWNNPAKFDKYIEQRFELVKEKHTWEHIFEDYEILMKALTKKEGITAA